MVGCIFFFSPPPSSSSIYFPLWSHSLFLCLSPCYTLTPGCTFSYCPVRCVCVCHISMWLIMHLCVCVLLCVHKGPWLGWPLSTLGHPSLHTHIHTPLVKGGRLWLSAELMWPEGRVAEHRAAGWQGGGGGRRQHCSPCPLRSGAVGTAPPWTPEGRCTSGSDNTSLRSGRGAAPRHKR